MDIDDDDTAPAELLIVEMMFGFAGMLAGAIGASLFFLWRF